MGLVESKECATRSVTNNSSAVGRQDAAAADNAATSTYKKIFKSDGRMNLSAKCEDFNWSGPFNPAQPKVFAENRGVREVQGEPAPGEKNCCQ